MPYGFLNCIDAQGEIKMSLLQKYQTHNVEKFLNDIERYSIGMDGWLNNVFSMPQTDLNYPPHNTVDEGDNKFLLEVALAGFKETEISVYTEENKLCISGTKDQKEKKYLHRGIANRSFKRFWTIPDGIEVRAVSFKDGMLSVHLEKIVQENQRRKTWF
jgi:molecular chaperone IbpA